MAEALQKRGRSTIPTNFVATAPAYNPQSGARRGNMPQADLQNPQTVALLEMLGLRWGSGLGPCPGSCLCVLSIERRAVDGAGGREAFRKGIPDVTHAHTWARLDADLRCWGPGVFWCWGLVLGSCPGVVPWGLVLGCPPH